MNNVQIKTIKNMTQEEISAMQSALAELETYERTRPMTKSEVSRLIIAQQINTLTVDDNTALRMTEFYPEWTTDTDYAAGFKVQRGGTLYKCLQAHMAQADWSPDAAPSLWAKVLIPDPDVIPAWEQPYATNAYMAGDKVTHNGKTWTSTVDNNVWTPGVYGWSEQA